MGDGKPTCNRVLTSGSVGMGIPMGIPMRIPVGMGWVWGLKCHPHGSPANKTVFEKTFVLYISNGSTNSVKFEAHCRPYI